MPSRFASGETTNKYDHVLKAEAVNEMYAISDGFSEVKKDIQNIKNVIADNTEEFNRKYSYLSSNILSAFDKVDRRFSTLANICSQMIYEFLPIILIFMLSSLGRFINYFHRSYYLSLEYRTQIRNNDTPYICIHRTDDSIIMDKDDFRKTCRVFKKSMKDCGTSKHDIIRNTVELYISRFQSI